MPRTSSKQEQRIAPRAAARPSAEQFTRIARRLARAAREIEIVNKVSGFPLFMHEHEVGRTEAATANRVATNVGAMSPEAALDELRRLKATAAYVEEHAWRGTAFYANQIGELDANGIRSGERRGLFMKIVMLRSASKPVPQRFVDDYMTNADRAERFMRLMGA